MISIENRYQYWLSQKNLDPTLKKELLFIREDPLAIEDRFWKDLSFGTGGLRGVLGAGDYRMNIYTVGKATQGLAAYLKENDVFPSVTIGYDTRNNSHLFALHSAKVFMGNGVKVYLYKEVRPTPMVSFAIRQTKSQGGIVITASHNPKEYNGYKVYGDDGCQITDEAAYAIGNHINQVDLFSQVATLSLEEGEEKGLLIHLGEEMDRTYYEKVLGLSLNPAMVKEKAKNLHILYTPLHGTGAQPVKTVLKALGYHLSTVKDQMIPDGNFSTLLSPNPEEPSAYTLAKEEALAIKPHVIFATDPDCDRIGVMAKDENGEYSLLTGNQIGALLCHYILKTKKDQGNLPKNGAVIKTIVTSDLPKKICDYYQVSLFETLTGFKYIGEKIGEWEESKAFDFLLGFEESYGYLAGTFVRDKDAVIAAMLIGEMALYYHSQSMTLHQGLEALFETYGYSREKLLSITLPGAQGQSQIAAMMDNLRHNGAHLLKNHGLQTIEDYESATSLNCSTYEKSSLTLPQSNVFKCIFEDGSWLTFRPSGTEPKMKIYIAVLGKSKKEGEDKLAYYEKLIDNLLK